MNRFPLRLFFLFLLSLGFVFVLHSSILAASPIGQSHIPVCPGANNEGSVRCHARVVVDGSGKPDASVTPAGYEPAHFRGAYNVSGIATTPVTIAIVDAYDHPNIKSDLDKYNSQYGLPYFPTCTTPSGTGCFLKVNQNGQSSPLPRTNAGWALEIAMDVEVAHAMCENCKLILVEANSNSYTDLMTAVDRARLMGATVISNSYGSGEFAGETAYDSYFDHAGVAFTFSSGDSGYGAGYPAASRYVTAVGGTTLNLNGTSWASETVWSGAGSGCSAYEAKPAWQTDLGCSRRTIADVSADADPNTGAAVYDSVRYQGRKGWFKVGGTSLSAPLVAGVYALSGNTSGAANSIPYGHPSSLHDITTGSNGNCGTYLCTGATGYDGPTGLGTPNGSGAF